MNPIRRLFLVFFLGAAVPSFVVGAPPAAHATEEATRKEARERFDRGLRLFNQGDNAGALAEFHHAYQLVPHPLVLFNIGMVQAAMRRPVEAVETLDRLLAAPGGLDATRLARAQELRAEQAARVGRIDLRANVSGAAVEVNGVEVARTPLPEPLSVASGEHIVSVIAPGHQPERRKVTVAGDSKVEVSLELQPLEGRLAHLVVKTNVPDAVVLLDGSPVGRTPLPASLAIAPGRHTLSIERPGYVTARKELDLGEGAAGDVTVELQIDGAALSSEGGLLQLDISEPDAAVFVNGEPVRAYGGALTLPVGAHRVRVERAEFLPFEREVQVSRDGIERVSVDLEPTPDKRADYRSSALGRRTVGWILTLGGTAVTGGGAGFLIWNQGQKQDAEATFDDAAAKHEAGGECDPARGLQTDACLLEVDLALDRLESRRSRDLYGYIGVGAGAAAAVLGVVLLVTGDDPDRYEPRPDSDVFAGVRMQPIGWAAPGGGGIGVIGRF